MRVVFKFIAVNAVLALTAFVFGANARYWGVL